MVKNLTKTEFLDRIFDYEKEQEWKFRGNKPVIIDFYADWCGPCQALAPILNEIAEEYADKVEIYKVNTEIEQELSAKFGIRSIPSLLFIPLDEEPQMAQGAPPKDALKRGIEEILLRA